MSNEITMNVEVDSEIETMENTENTENTESIENIGNLENTEEEEVVEASKMEETLKEVAIEDVVAMVNTGVESSEVESTEAEAAENIVAVVEVSNKIMDTTTTEDNVVMTSLMNTEEVEVDTEIETKQRTLMKINKMNNLP